MSLPSAGSLTSVVGKEQDAWLTAFAQTTPITNS
jgi:hypothetical protein